jgi:hypothetical protein
MLVETANEYLPQEKNSEKMSTVFPPIIPQLTVKTVPKLKD